VNAGDTCLFTNLSSGNNEIYLANGVGTNITSWTAQYSFHGSQSPSNGDMVYVLKGNSFENQLGKFDSTFWNFNYRVRHFFNADYWEQSAIFTGNIFDNTVNGNVYTIAWSGSQHQIVDYSIVRGAIKETGTMHIVTDGSTVQVNTDSAYVNGNSGVTFSGVISGSNLTIQYTSTSTGISGTIKFIIKRWSSSAGGPGGPPSYSAAAPLTAAASPVNGIQFNSGGFLAGNTNFEIDVVDLSMNLNGLRQGVLSSGITILDNQSSWTNLFSIPNTYPYMVFEYSVAKAGFTRVGTLLVTYDGTNVAFNDSFVESGATGVVLQAIVSGGNIQFQYMSTSTGGNGTFKYSWRKWN